MRKCFFLLGFLLALVSCTERDKRPEVFLGEKQMIDIITDSYLIEAQLNRIKSSGTDVSELQTVYYDEMFEHYGITDSIFEQNMRYYTRQPAVLQRIMDSVTDRFARAQ